MRRKSVSCFSKPTGKPLSEYASKSTAQKAADHANIQYGNDLVPYQCSKCRKWHLSPKHRQTPNTKCHKCTGSDGKRKALYDTEVAADNRVAILLKEKGVDLTVYKCPYNRGWHLSKGLNP